MEKTNFIPIRTIKVIEVSATQDFYIITTNTITWYTRSYRAGAQGLNGEFTNEQPK